MIVAIRTVAVTVLNPKGPNIFVQNGDAAYSSKIREVVDSKYDASPGNISRPQQYGTDGCATPAVLPADDATGRLIFSVVLAACWLYCWLCS